jgi:hypothetical protein
MNKFLKISAAGAGLLGAGLGLAFWSGAACWNGETARMVEELKRAASTGGAKSIPDQKFTGLPAPVSRYFKFALGEDQPMIRVARLRHAGEFYMNDSWIPFESEEFFSARAPAFVWDAKMKMSPFLSVRVRDAYQNGQGLMQAKVFSLFTVMNAGGRDEKLAAGELQRYLAEAVWLPTALLPDEHLQWSEMDDTHARATLTDSGVTVSLEFEFGESGEIVGVFSPARFREIGGEYKPFPWRGRFKNYRLWENMMLPTEGEVEWQLPEGNLPYWRGRMLEAEFQYDESGKR